MLRGLFTPPSSTGESPHTVDPNARETLSRPKPGRYVSETLMAEYLSEMRALSVTLTEIAARLSGRITNTVLEVKTAIIPANGHIDLAWGAAAGTITVNVTGANPVWVSAQSAVGDVAPTIGVGLFKIGGTSWRTVPLASHEATIWGTAGDTVSWIATTQAPTPVVG